jgi:hypothetical protein
MDWSMDQAPSGKAAAASNRAKRGFLVACLLLAAGLYIQQEPSHRDAGASQRDELQDLQAHFAVRFDESASVNVRRVFYNKEDGVSCGEVNGRDNRGGTVKLKDGVRIFVCGPSVPERPGM